MICGPVRESARLSGVRGIQQLPQATVRTVINVSFEVEQAGCESCATRIRAALEPLLEISALEIDESRDAAVVVARSDREPRIETIDTVLAAASEGAGHKYRVRPGSLRVVS